MQDAQDQGTAPDRDARSGRYFKGCRPKLRYSEADRFWARVRPGTGEQCWEWTGTTRGHMGYGCFKRSRSRSGTSAHRYSYELHYGAIPDGAHVLHRCDNPRCVNPQHLWAGTNKENSDDRDSKGRHVPMRGESNGDSRLTEDQVRTIRARHSEGVTSKNQLAREYGISSTAIGYIISRRLWKHVV